MALTQEQLDIITRTVLGEARGEGELGMAAVAHNIRNRSLSGKFPSDPAKVALQPYQYSAWNKGEGGNNPQQFSPSSRQYQNARKLVEEVWGGTRPDPTNGALFYHTPQVSPAWAGEVNKHGTTRVGNHIFYNGHPVPPGEIPNVVASQTDTTPPQQITGKSNTPTSAASRQVPTNWFTPRLAPGNGDIYSYHIPDQTPASLTGGYASLTPDRAPPPLPRPRPGMPVVPYDRGQTIASVPTPQRQSLPPLPPSSMAPANFVTTSMDRANAAVDPGLQRALEASGVGKPPASRSVPSVPVRTAQAGPMNDIGAMPSFAGFSSAFAPPPPPVPTTAVPGPNAMPKGDERLVAGIYPSTAGHGLPPAVPDVGVASAMSVIPPMPRPRPVPFSMPTPMGQRPTLPMPRANPFAMPTPVAQRPNPNALRVTVNGAGSYNAPQRAPTPTREQQIAAILARSRGPAAFGGGGTIDGAVQPIGTLSGRR